MFVLLHIIRQKAATVSGVNPQEPAGQEWTLQQAVGGPTGGGAWVRDVCLHGFGGGLCAKTSRCVRAVRLGPVSDTPSLGGVGAVGCTIMSPWALCNYALT